MKKAPKKISFRPGYKNGGEPKNTPPPDIKSGDQLPAGASKILPSQGYNPEAGRILDDKGNIVGFYYMPIGTTTTNQSAATATTTNATPLVSTPPEPSPSPTATQGSNPAAPLAPETQTAEQIRTARAQQREAFNKSLESWKSPTAQKVPRSIAEELEKNIRPNVLAKQAILDQALAKKYGKAYNAQTGPAIGQALSYDEGVKAIGNKEDYDNFLQDIYSYEGYRKKTLGTYDTQSITAGKTDPAEQMYGTRMSNLFKVTPEQAAANIKKTPKEVLDFQKNPVIQKTDKAVNKPDVVTMIEGVQNKPIPTGTVLDANGKPIPAGLIDPKTGKPYTSKDITTGFKKGGKIPKGMKRKRYADGNTVMPDLSSLTADQIAQYNALPDSDRQAFLDSLSVGMPDAAKSPSSSVMGSLPYQAIGSLSGQAVDNISVDPANKRASVAQAMGSTALKRAGTGAAIGATIGSVVPVLGTGIGAAAGATLGAEFGAIEGMINGRKKNKKYAEDQSAAAAEAAKTASFTAQYGKKDGGKIEGPGTAKSDSIKAEVPAGSFIVPAENAKKAEMLREAYFGKPDKEAVLHGGDTMVKLSNGEHMFSPDEVTVLEANGVDLDGLAPNAEETGYGKQKGGEVKGEYELSEGGHVSSEKAKEILKDGTAHGKKLTTKQQRYFGWVAGGMKKAEGGFISAGDVRDFKRGHDAMMGIEKRDGFRDGGGVGDLSDEELKKKRDEIAAEIESLSGPGDNLAQRSMLQAAKEKVLAEYDAEIKNRQDKKNTSYPEFAAVDSSGNPVKKSDPGQQIFEQAFSDPNIGKPESTPAKNTTTTKNTTPGGEKKSSTTNKQAVADIQAAFIKEHGGIGDQSAAPVVTEKTAASSASSAISDLVTAYNKAETLEEVESIRTQLHDMGYQIDYDGGAKTWNAVPIMGGNAKPQGDVMSSLPTTATTSIPPANASATQLANAELGADDTADVGQRGANIPSAVKNVFDSLGGAGGALALGQVGLGLWMGAKDKAPVDQVDPGLLKAQQEAAARAQYGFTPEALAQAKNKIESNRRAVMGNIVNVSGGNAGMAVANSRLAAIDANQSNLGLASASQNYQGAKQAQADQLSAQVAANKRMIFQDELNRYQQNQAVSANLIGAGVSNLFGAIQNQDQQQRMDDRVKKYGNQAIFANLMPTT